MPTLRQLEYLVAIQDFKHFGKAAAAVHVSQPTLSQQIRALEALFTVVLVERGSAPVQLTPVGRELAHRARKLLLDVDDMRALAKRSSEGLAGTIRFGISPTLGPYLMPAIVASLHKKYPDMRLYIREGIPDEQLQQLRSGALDMMVMPLPVVGGDLHVEPMFREPLHMVAPPDHAICGKNTLSKTDFKGAQVLSLDPRHHFHRQAIAVCEELGASLLLDYEGTSLDSLRQMAGSGIGLAILPELYLRSEVGGENMVTRLTIQNWSASRSIAAVWRNGIAYAESYQMIANAITNQARSILDGSGQL